MDRLMDYLNNLGVDFAVLNGYKVVSDIIRFSNNNLDIIRTHDKSVIGIDIGFKKRRLYTDIHVMDFERARDAIDRMIKAVDYVPPSPLYPEVPDKKMNYSIIPNIYSEDSNVEIALDMVRTLTRLGRRYRLESVAGSIRIDRVKHIVSTSYGGSGEYKKSRVNINVRLYKKQYISSVFNREVIGLEDIEIEEGFIEAYNLIRRVNKAMRVEPGRYSIILSPMVVANLLSHLARGFSAYNVYIQNSPFIDKLGEQVLESSLSIYDNALEPSNPGAKPFDVEGIPTSDLAIVENGVLKTYLHNLSTAGVYQVESTGHAGRLMPSPHSLTVKPGSASSLDNLFIDVKDGIYITNVWYTRFQNFVKGDFSTIQRDVALVIRNGEVRDAVYGCRISDNLVRMFNNIIGYADDNVWVRWWDTRIVSNVPHIAFSDIEISTGY